jgi:hypothetical protein
MSTKAELTVAQALEIGQIEMAQIVEYVSYMGVMPEFVTALAQAGPSDINILSERELKELKVVSLQFETTWEIKAFEGSFYVLGTTTTDNGVHKMAFICNGGKGPRVMMLYNSNGEYQQSVLNYTRFYEMDFDDKELELAPDEIIETVKRSGPEYLEATIYLTPRLINLLKTASTVGFKMIPPSRQIYAGWNSDFASGREKVFEYMKSCR